MLLVAIVKSIVDLILALLSRRSQPAVGADGIAAPRTLRERVAARMRERRGKGGPDPSDSLGGRDAE